VSGGKIMVATEFTEGTEIIIPSAQLVKSAGKANNYLFFRAFRVFRG
jgi:hypothetical protein